MLAALSLVLLLLSLPAIAQDPVNKFKEEFDQEKDPVRKARLLPRLGDAQLDEAGDYVGKGEMARALTLLEEYRDSVKAAHEALKSSGINAEKKPKGFKQLEIHLRQGIRRMEDIIVAVPYDDRKPFEAIRKQLEGIDQELIEMLFPRRPGKHPPLKDKL